MVWSRLSKVSPVGIYLLKVNNRNTKTRCEICSKLAIKAPCSSVSIVNFEDVNTDWDIFCGFLFRYENRELDLVGKF